MASEPNSKLPLLYNDLMPLNTRDHSDWRMKPAAKAPWLAKQHAIPLTVEEFPLAQRDLPIVFSSGPNPVPLALFGLNEGVNTFVSEDGTVDDEIYIPAYVRRYPFLLAKLDSKSENMSLCFDPTVDTIGDFKEGEALFVDGQPSDFTKAAMEFAEKFEQAGQRTQSFVEELKKHDLLMEGEVSIQRGDGKEEQPYIYRGFQMINQEKFREVRGDQLRTWNQNGFLPLVYAHFFSLNLMRVIFARQVEQGKGPVAKTN